MDSDFYSTSVEIVANNGSKKSVESDNSCHFYSDSPVVISHKHQVEIIAIIPIYPASLSNFYFIPQFCRIYKQVATVVSIKYSFDFDHELNWYRRVHKCHIAFNYVTKGQCPKIEKIIGLEVENLIHAE